MVRTRNYLKILLDKLSKSLKFLLTKCNNLLNSLRTFTEGLDFFYANEASARKMVDFLSSVIPCRYDHSKKLISHDIHSNIYNYKITYR